MTAMSLAIVGNALFFVAMWVSLIFVFESELSNFGWQQEPIQTINRYAIQVFPLAARGWWTASQPIPGIPATASQRETILPSN
jgi:hypothetical protein